MPLKIHRKEKESSQNLIRRFTKMVRQSGLLLEVRKRQFHGRKKSRLAKQKAALRREELKKEREILKKIGKK